MSKVALIVDISLRPGTAEAFLARGRQHAETCLAREAGCLRFDVLVPEGASDRVIFYELYANAEALETHRATDHIARFFEDTGAMVDSRSRTLCTVVDD